MTNANIKQDSSAGQFGHDEYHFDNNAFDEDLRLHRGAARAGGCIPAKKDVASAWMAFGRMTHTVQDFYAHSNYITLWLAASTGARLLPRPKRIRSTRT